MPIKQALQQQQKLQLKEAPDHFLGLEVQGLIARSVTDLIPSHQIKNWSKFLESLPGYIFNFIRKATQSQLPTLSNLHRWGRSPSAL